MGHTREKKPLAYTQEAIQEASAITDDFKDFTDGFRVLLLIHRSKDGATHSSRHERMLFSSNIKEFEETLAFLLEERSKHIFPGLRIYSTANSRDLRKSIQLFKHAILDIEMQDDNVLSDFYLSIKSRFASCLMRPASRSSSNFIFDIDDPMTLDEALKIFEDSGFTDKIIKQYKTKNGWHIVTEPFNYTKLISQIPFHKDGLLLLKY